MILIIEGSYPTYAVSNGPAGWVFTWTMMRLARSDETFVVKWCISFLLHKKMSKLESGKQIKGIKRITTSLQPSQDTN